MTDHQTYLHRTSILSASDIITLTSDIYITSYIVHRTYFLTFVPQFFSMSIQVTNLLKKYGEQKAVDNISFNVAKGEIVGFLGPNGAGNLPQ